MQKKASIEPGLRGPGRNKALSHAGNPHLPTGRNQMTQSLVLGQHITILQTLHVYSFTLNPAV